MSSLTFNVCHCVSGHITYIGRPPPWVCAHNTFRHEYTHKHDEMIFFFACSRHRHNVLPQRAECDHSNLSLPRMHWLWLLFGGTLCFFFLLPCHLFLLILLLLHFAFFFARFQYIQYKSSTWTKFWKIRKKCLEQNVTNSNVDCGVADTVYLCVNIANTFSRTPRTHSCWKTHKYVFPVALCVAGKRYCIRNEPIFLVPWPTVTVRGASMPQYLTHSTARALCVNAERHQPNANVSVALNETYVYSPFIWWHRDYFMNRARMESSWAWS